MTDTIIATPNPGPVALTGASGLSVLLGWGVATLATRYQIPPEVIGAGLSGLATVGTSLWHRFFGPAVPVSR